jgi:multiple sugar transport system substrate-binding protein
MRKVMLLLAVLILTSTVVFAGGTKEAAPNYGNTIRWSYWGGEARLRAVQQAIDIYTGETGNVVAGEPAPGTNEHFDKFLVQFAGGYAADIVQLGGYFTNLQLADDNKTTKPPAGDYLLDLTPYTKNGKLDISNVDTAAINAGTRDGKLYAIPVAMNMPAMIYNKSLLERVGAPLPKVSMTWAEFETWLGQVQAKLPNGTYAMTDNSATASGSVFFGYWAGQNGTPQWDGAKTSMTAAAAQQYFDLWAKWRTNGWVPPASVSADYAETNEASAAIIAGKTACVQVWSNSIANYQAATRDDLQIIELPNAAVSNGLWGQMSQMMAINKKTKNPDAAVQFLNFYTNDARAWAILKDTYGMPVTPAGRAAVSATASDTVKKQLAYLDVAGKHASPPNPNMPNDTEWNQGLHLIAQNVAYGRITAAAGGQQVMDLINRLTR